MVDIGDVETRLRDAVSTWATVRGVVRHHRRHDLVTIGFERHFAALESRGWRVGPAPAGAVAAAIADRREIEAILAVAAHGPERRRVQTLSRRGDDWFADLVVVDGQTWWARTADGVLTNNGDPLFRHGGTGELDLLTPAQVVLGYDLTPAAEHDVVAGRQSTVVMAVPRPRQLGPRVPGSEVFAMITGGDRFRLSVDDATGVLLKVVKEVDDEDAETVEFTEIEFGVELSDDLFAAIR